RGDDLRAVEELEERGDADERDGAFDDLTLRGEHAREKSREKRENHGPRGHRCDAEHETDAARTPRAASISRADGEADAHRGRLRDAERAHEGEAREVEGDLVPGGGASADAAHEHGDEGEDA